MFWLECGVFLRLLSFREADDLRQEGMYVARLPFWWLQRLSDGSTE